jgi:hypothetical protein
MTMVPSMERAAAARAPQRYHGESLASKITLHWLIGVCLCLSFLLALLEFHYRSPNAQLTHVALFCLAGLLVLCGRHRTERLQGLFAGGGLLMTAVFFGEAISYISHDTYSITYGVVFILIIFSARLIVQEVGMPAIIRAYSQAAILTVTFFLTFDLRKVLAGTSARFSGSSGVHPNLVGFILGGFFPVIVWRALEYKVRWKKRVAVFLAAMTFFIIFLTGSRGTLSAISTAGVLLVLRAVAFERWLSRIRIGHSLIIAALVATPMVMVLLVQHNRIGHFLDFLVTTLQLNSSQRGINSGFSGRTYIWHITLNILRAENRWLIGFGYRAGDRLVGTIDNGYIQLLFESGLIAGSMILGSMIRVLVLTWKAAGLAQSGAWRRYYTALWCLMVIYFMNNVSTRYLFSFGSSFSLCVLCMMTCSRRELVGAGTRKPAPEPAAPARRAVRRELAWDRTGQF